MYVTLPTALDVRLCLMTNRHLCMFNQALYPVEQTDWRVYALSINDEKCIEKNCILKAINHTTNLAYNLNAIFVGHKHFGHRMITIKMCYGDTYHHYFTSTTNH